MSIYAPIDTWMWVVSQLNQLGFHYPKSFASLILYDTEIISEHYQNESCSLFIQRIIVNYKESHWTVMINGELNYPKDHDAVIDYIKEIIKRNALDSFKR